MKQMNKIYRCIPEFVLVNYVDGKPIWDYQKHNLDNFSKPLLNIDFAMVWCYSGKIICTKESNKVLRLDFRTSTLLTSLRKKIEEIIKPIEIFYHDEGGAMWINYSDFDKIAQTIKAKPQCKKTLAIHNTDNITYWERYLRIWNPEYLELLHKDYTKVIATVPPNPRKKKAVRNDIQSTT